MAGKLRRAVRSVWRIMRNGIRKRPKRRSRGHPLAGTQPATAEQGNAGNREPEIPEIKPKWRNLERPAREEKFWELAAQLRGWGQGRLYEVDLRALNEALSYPIAWLVLVEKLEDHRITVVPDSQREVNPRTGKIYW